MSLDDIEVEQYLLSISTGTRFFSIDDKLLIFKHPNSFVKMKADLLYNTEFEKAKSNGLLDQIALEKLIEERNLFTEADRKQLDSLNAKLEGQRVLLAKTTIVKANQDRIKKVISDIQKQIQELTYQKTSKMMMSAEVRASEEKSLFLCWSCVYDENEELYWKSYSDFKTTTDILFRGRVLSSFLEFYGGLSNKLIRFIARHNLWRIRYVNSQKVSEALFGVPSAEYTNDMLSLAYWSNFYDNIYQMMPEDRPSDNIIEDDDALDAYMSNYYEERNREDTARRSKKKTPGKLSAFDSEEVIVTASNELWRDIDYDKPREAQKLKDRLDIKKKVKQRR